MQEATLPSPDTGSKGYHLRRVAVNVINQLDMVAPSYPLGSHPGAVKLAAFFDACRLAALETGKRNPTMTFTPATSSGIVGSTTTLTLNKGGSTGTTTSVISSDPTIASVVAATGVVTRLKVGQVTITASVAADANYRAETITATVTVTA
jgi:hypothetical protein